MITQGLVLSAMEAPVIEAPVIEVLGSAVALGEQMVAFPVMALHAASFQTQTFAPLWTGTSHLRTVWFRRLFPGMQKWGR